jgi:hypothetical protein
VIEIVARPHPSPIQASAGSRSKADNSPELGREGTGKTLVGRWHAEASEAWRRDRSWPFEAWSSARTRRLLPAPPNAALTRAAPMTALWCRIGQGCGPG